MQPEGHPVVHRPKETRKTKRRTQQKQHGTHHAWSLLRDLLQNVISTRALPIKNPRRPTRIPSLGGVAEFIRRVALHIKSRVPTLQWSSVANNNSAGSRQYIQREGEREGEREGGEREREGDATATATGNLRRREGTKASPRRDWEQQEAICRGILNRHFCW